MVQLENTSGKSRRKLEQPGSHQERLQTQQVLNVSCLKSKTTFGADVGQLGTSGVDCPCPPKPRDSSGDKSPGTKSSVVWGCSLAGGAFSFSADWNS